MRKAAFINFVFKYSTVIIQLIINSILARLISSQEFGVIAIITVFTSLFSILSDMGFGTAIIQYKNLGKRDYENIFSFTFYLGFILSVLFVLFSFVIVYLYHNSVYIQLGCILAFSVFFNTINMVPNTLLYKNQEFVLIGVRTLITAVLGGILTVFLALMNFSYYSIVINSVFVSVIIFIWNYTKNPIRIRFKFEWSSINTIMRYSFYQFMFSFINYFSRNTDTLLVGRSFGESGTGYYDKAYKLMTYPITMFSGIITPILHPILSNYQDDYEIIYEKFMQIFSILFYLSLFVSTMCYFAPKEIIRILYGNKWDNAILCFKILSLSVITQMCSNITGSIFQSLGKTKQLFKAGCISTLIILMCTFFGVYLGTIETVSFMVMVGYIIVFFIGYYLLIKFGFKKSFKAFLKKVYKLFIIFILMIIFISFIPVNINNVFISLAVKIVIDIVIYILLLIIFKEFNHFKETLKIILRRN